MRRIAPQVADCVTRATRRSATRVALQPAAAAKTRLRQRAGMFPDAITVSNMETTYLEREEVIRWMVVKPTYRVDFWREISAGDPSRDLAPGWKQDSYYVTDADVDEVLAWSKTEASGRPIVVYLVFARRDGEPGLIRLAGEDPTDPARW